MSSIRSLGIQGTYIINMEKRPDKRAFSINELAEIGIDSPIIIDAIDAQSWQMSSKLIDRPGALGCILSHRMALNDAVLRGYETIFICEDDIVTPPNFKDVLDAFLSELPADWGILMLGWNDRNNKKEHLSTNVLLPIRPYGTQAIVYRGKEVIEKVYETSKVLDHWDLHTERLSKQIPTYLPTETLFDQIRSESDIYYDYRKPHQNAWYVTKWKNFQASIK